MGYHSYRIDCSKWMLHAQRSGEAMDWLIDHMTTASQVGGNDLTPVMEHWYSDPEDVLSLIHISREDLRLAHQTQTELIQGEARGEKQEVSLMMVHAQDHLTTAMMMADQAEEFLNIYRLLSSLLKKEDSE